MLFLGSCGESGTIGSEGDAETFETCLSLLGLVTGLESVFVAAFSANETALLGLKEFLRSLFGLGGALLFGCDLLCEAGFLMYFTVFLVGGAAFFASAEPVLPFFLVEVPVAPFSLSEVCFFKGAFLLAGELRCDFEGVRRPLGVATEILS